MSSAKARIKSKTITGQATYCHVLMDVLHGNIEGRERLRSSLDTFPDYGYGGMERHHTKTAIKRKITELRLALLDLSKMIDD